MQQINLSFVFFFLIPIEINRDFFFKHCKKNIYKKNMLNETEEFLSMIKNQDKIKQLKRVARKAQWQRYKKIGLKILIGLSIGIIIIFPVQSGTIIGTWINDFFVTIYKNMIK